MVNKAKMTFRFDTTKPVAGQPTRPMEQTIQTVNNLQNIGHGHAQVNHEPKQVEAQDEPNQRQDHEQQDKLEYHQAHIQVHDQLYEESNYTQHERVTYRPVDTSTWGDPFVDHVDLGGSIYPVEGSSNAEQIEPPPSHYNYRKHTTNWWKLSGSIAGAVMTGILFGAVVLSIFNQDITMPVPTGGVPSQSDPATPVSSSTPNSNPSLITIPPVGIKLPDKTYYFLQYGVFSTAQGVKLAQEELRRSGIAAARDTIDEKRVYAGVSSQREQAKLLGNELKAQGVNLIIHEVVFPQTAVIPFQGEAATLEKYVEQSETLVDLLSTASADRLQQAKAKAQDQAEMKTMQKAHQEWITAAAGIQGKLANQQLEAVTAMEKSMYNAVEAMNEFNKKGAKTLLWEVQNELMKFIMAQQQLFTA